jgi:hypothetical protein
MTSLITQIESFDGVEAVVAESMRFKAKLGIGDDAYASIKVGKHFQELWDIGGVAATASGIASSSTVAGMFFSSGGWLGKP